MHSRNLEIRERHRNYDHYAGDILHMSEAVLSEGYITGYNTTGNGFTKMIQTSTKPKANKQHQ